MEGSIKKAQGIVALGMAKDAEKQGWLVEALRLHSRAAELGSAESATYMQKFYNYNEIDQRRARPTIKALQKDALNSNSPTHERSAVILSNYMINLTNMLKKD